VKRANSSACDWPSLIKQLPQLGAVLALVPCRSIESLRARAPQAPWPGAVWLMHLMCAKRLCAKSVVSSEGPYEYLSFFDASGEMCFQIFRLPDSDYFAWDTFMATQSTLQNEHAVLPLAAYVNCEAHIFRFHHADDEGLDGSRLDALAPKYLSSIGYRYAKNFSQRLSVKLHTPSSDCCCESQSHEFSREYFQ
jgi:hypothetical protein